MDLVWGLLDLWVVATTVTLAGGTLVVVDPADAPVATLLLALPLLFLLPGYACISALAPRRGGRRVPATGDGDGGTAAAGSGVGLAERLVLGAGTSVGVAVATGFGLHLTGVGIEHGAVVATLCAVALLGCLVAAVRRYRVDPDERFDGRVLVSSLAPLRGLFARRSTADAAITALIVVSLVGILAGSALVAVSVDDREGYTELYVLGTNGSGDPVAAAYPADGAGDGEVLVGVENREGRSTTYALVVHSQRVDGDSVVRSAERDRFRLDLDPGESWRTTYPVPTDGGPPGERLLFTLYVDAPPEEPDRGSAYRAVHVWLGPTDGTDEE